MLLSQYNAIRRDSTEASMVKMDLAARLPGRATVTLNEQVVVFLDGSLAV